MQLGVIAVVVNEYDPAISFFLDALGFELVNDSRPRRATGVPSGGR